MADDSDSDNGATAMQAESSAKHPMLSASSLREESTTEQGSSQPSQRQSSEPQLTSYLYLDKRQKLFNIAALIEALGMLYATLVGIFCIVDQTANDNVFATKDWRSMFAAGLAMYGVSWLMYLASLVMTLQRKQRSSVIKQFKLRALLRCSYMLLGMVWTLTLAVHFYNKFNNVPFTDASSKFSDMGIQPLSSHVVAYFKWFDMMSTYRLFWFPNAVIFLLTTTPALEALPKLKGRGD